MEEGGNPSDIVRLLRSCQASLHLLDERQIENEVSVGSDSISFDDKTVVGHGMHYPELLVNRDVFSDSHNERHLSFDSFLYGFCCFIRCNVHRRCIGFQLILGLSNPLDTWHERSFDNL